MDYKRKGVEDVCEIKRNSEKRALAEQRTNKRQDKREKKGELTKSLSRRIFEIISEAEDVKSVIPDLAYLAARNDGLDPNSELGSLVLKLLDMINRGTDKGDLIKYMEGVVMAVYVIEEAKENKLDPYKFLGC